MVGVKTVHDVRSLRNLNTRGVPTSESIVYLQLHRLASEKLRLEDAVEALVFKKQSYEKRLGEIEQQMDTLRRSCPTGQATESTESSPGKNWQQVVVEY